MVPRPTPYEPSRGRHTPTSQRHMDPYIYFKCLFSLYGTRASMIANNGKHDTIDLYNTGSRIQKLFKIQFRRVGALGPVFFAFSLSENFL